jgi:hypothetical protein
MAISLETNSDIKMSNYAYSSDIYVRMAITHNSVPIFKKMLVTAKVDLRSEGSKYVIKMPEMHDPEGEKVTIKVGNHPEFIKFSDH